MTSLFLTDFELKKAEAVDAIKKLQHCFGYLLDSTDWSATAELFTEDAVLRVGHHLPVHGRQAIEEYLPQVYDLDLHIRKASIEQVGPETQNHLVRAHLQIMPVITVSADLQSAQATWRHLSTGGSAETGSYWAEGPQEISYSKYQGEWRITRLFWFRHLVVPYRQGWQYAADQTRPDKYRTDFRSWPDVKASSFHFLHQSSCVLREEVDTVGTATEASPDLIPRINRLEATRMIENLQGMLGYYIDKCQWSQAVKLFTSTSRIVNGSQVLAEGSSNILQLFREAAPEGPLAGLLLDLILLQPVITVADDTSRAHARWKVLAQLGLSEHAHEWGLANLEVNYVNTPAGWRIDVLQIKDIVFTDYDLGWDLDQRSDSKVLSQIHVLTAPTATGVPAGPPSEVSLDDPTPSLGPNARLKRIRAAQDVERLQYVYGYCLAEFLWDELTDLFADHGTIEIALRGIYCGRESIRRSLELYGHAPQNGVLHNHMQFQPVIHLDTEGQTAFIRARALSMMGTYGKAATWMGGVYENRLSLVNDEWKMELDRIVNTYFAPYEVGWKNLAYRLAPGVSSVIPPDEAPTEQFDMYPGLHFVHYHYAEPQNIE